MSGRKALLRVLLEPEETLCSLNLMRLNSGYSGCDRTVSKCTVHKLKIKLLNLSSTGKSNRSSYERSGKMIWLDKLWSTTNYSNTYIMRIKSISVFKLEVVSFCIKIDCFYTFRSGQVRFLIFDYWWSCNLVPAASWSNPLALQRELDGGLTPW